MIMRLKMPKLNKTTVLRSLNKEFKKLEKGKLVKTKVNIDLSFEVPLKLYWEEDDYAQYEWNENIAAKYKDYVFEEIDRACILDADKYSLEIKKFIEKCNDFASQFNQEEYKFFNEVVNFGKDKEYKKSLSDFVKKRINIVKNKMAALNKELVELDLKCK